jgi:phenylpropionate dioxygenase-like ring-hydroxylating dioxygenase large terminal subunit
MFVRNVWYVAALAREVTTEPLARTLLGDPVVIYRTEGGTPAILSDICPHRAAMLSRGRVEGEAIVCGYHGFTFDQAGHCIRVPGQARIPAQADVRCYPVIERWGWLFVWMGDAALAPQTPLPDYHWLVGPDWEGRDDLLSVKANYTLVRDNLLDLTHAQFVHQKTLATAAVTETPAVAERVDGLVLVTRDMRGIDPSPFFKRLGGFTGKVDHHQTIEFTPPCHVVIKVRVAAVAGNDGMVCNMRVLNALTPETTGSTLYFWGLTRDFAREDKAATDLAHRMNRDTFQEDVAVLEGQQTMLDVVGSRFTPLATLADLGCVLAGRLMQELAEEEGVAGAAATSPAWSGG